MQTAAHEPLAAGAGKLVFVSIDEKPYYSNAIDGLKVWARRGSKKKNVKEKRAAMLERWTGMTACYSRVGTVPKWAALFKAMTGSRIHLRTPENVKVQFAPNGSYRTEQVLDYLDWLLPDVENPEETQVPVLDWYSAHLADEVQELVANKTGSLVLYIGGGTTGIASVCDVVAHHELSQHYKQAEAEDHSKALRLRPCKVPAWTKQDVLDRGFHAWKLLRHDRMCPGHKQTGYTTAIEGEDHLIMQDLLPFWHSPRLNMPETRRLIRTQVTTLWRNGVVTCWQQAAEVGRARPSQSHPRRNGRCQRRHTRFRGSRER